MTSNELTPPFHQPQQLVPDYCNSSLQVTYLTHRLINPTMAAEVQENDLSKVDSAIDDAPASPSDKKEIKHRRTSSTVSGVFNINDLGEYDELALSSRQCY